MTSTIRGARARSLLCAALSAGTALAGAAQAQEPVASRQGAAPVLTKVASFEHQVTGVTVS